MKKILLAAILLTACAAQTNNTVKPSTEPSATPIVLESPSATPVPTPTPRPKYKVKFRAAVLNNSGDIKPVPRTNFVANPWNIEVIQSELIIKNNPGIEPKEPVEPDEPSLSDAKYLEGFPKAEDYKNSENFADDFARDMEAYRLRREEAYQQDVIKYNRAYEQYQKDLAEFPVKRKAWEDIAYKGMNERMLEAAQGRQQVKFTTDLSGEAEIELEEGTYYFTGNYNILSFSSHVFWINVRFEINENTKVIELSNDNGEVINI